MLQSYRKWVFVLKRGEGLYLCYSPVSWETVGQFCISIMCHSSKKETHGIIFISPILDTNEVSDLCFLSFSSSKAVFHFMPAQVTLSHVCDAFQFLPFHLATASAVGSSLLLWSLIATFCCHLWRDKMLGFSSSRFVDRTGQRRTQIFFLFLSKWGKIIYLFIQFIFPLPPFLQ